MPCGRAVSATTGDRNVLLATSMTRVNSELVAIARALVKRNPAHKVRVAASSLKDFEGGRKRGMARPATTDKIAIAASISRRVNPAFRA